MSNDKKQLFPVYWFNYCLWPCRASLASAGFNSRLRDRCQSAPRILLLRSVLKDIGARCFQGGGQTHREIETQTAFYSLCLELACSYFTRPSNGKATPKVSGRGEDTPPTSRPDKDGEGTKDSEQKMYV